MKLRICNACGAFLSIFDNDKRLADHLGGKLHLGYVVLRQRLKEIEASGGGPATRDDRRDERRDRDRDRDRYDSRREYDDRRRDDRRRDDRRRDDRRDYDSRRETTTRGGKTGGTGTGTSTTSWCVYFNSRAGNWTDVVFCLYRERATRRLACATRGSRVIYGAFISISIWDSVWASV